MINKKIIISLLLCAQNIFSMQANLPRSINEFMPVDKTITYIHRTYTESGDPLDFCYNKSDKMVICEAILRLTDAPFFDTNNLQQSQNGTGDINCSDTCNYKEGANTRSVDTQKYQQPDRERNGASPKPSYTIGNGRDGISIPAIDTLRLCKCAFKWLSDDNNAPIESLTTAQQAKKIGFKNPEKYKTIIRDGLFKNAKITLSNEINKDLNAFNFLQLWLPEDIKLAKDLLEIDAILLEINRDKNYKKCSDMHLISIGKKDNITELADSEEALAINQAKQSILNDLLLKTDEKSDNNSQSNKLYAHSGVEIANKNSNAEILLDAIFDKNFTLTIDGLETKKLIKKVGVKSDEKYKALVQDKLVDSARKVYVKLTKNFRSKLSSLSAEELKNLRKNIKTKLDQSKKKEPILKKDRDEKYKSYKEYRYFKSGKKIKLEELVISDEAYAKNTAEELEYQDLLDTIESMIQDKEGKKPNTTETKQHEKNTNSTNLQDNKSESKQDNVQIQNHVVEETSDTKNDSMSVQDQKDPSKYASINIGNNTTIKVTVAQIRAKSLEDAKVIAQEDSNTEHYNSKTGEPTENTTFFYDKHERNTKERKEAAEKDIKTGGACRTQKYTLTTELQSALLNIGLDPNSFTSVTGTESQHVTQQQILQIGNMFARKSHNLGPDLTVLGLNLLNTANLFNATGNVIKANGLVDFCSGVVSIAKGATTGLINVLNPIRMAEGYIFLASKIIELSEITTLGVMAYTPLVGLEGIPSIGKKVKAFQGDAKELLLARLCDIRDNTKALAKQLKLAYKNSSRNERLEHGTAIIIETLLTGKVQKCYYKFLKNQVPKIANFAKRVAEAKKIEDVILTTADGFELSLSQEIVKSVGNNKIVDQIIEKVEKDIKNGCQLIGEGSTLRKVDYMHGLKHAINNHLFGSGKSENFPPLKYLDPKGNPEKWAHHIISLTQTGEGQIKTIKTGEIIEILGKMPKTDGGFVDVGVRMFRATGSDTWRLNTILTQCILGGKNG